MTKKTPAPRKTDHKANQRADQPPDQPANLWAKRNRLLFLVTFCVLFAAAQLLPACSRQAEILRFPNLSAPLMPSDPDIWVYLTQVRQWLADGLGLFPLSPGAFFDHIVRNTNAPFNGFVIHWTRPMEMLLALFYAFTPASLSLNLRVLLAANWLPPFMCLAALALLAGTARRYFRYGGVIALTVLLMLANPEIDKNFAAGNADHHGLLCLLWCGVLYELLNNRLAARGAALIGVLLGVMTWIGIEGLVMAGFVFGLLGLEALFRPEKIRLLAASALACALTTTLGLFIEMPPAGILSHPVYDTLSIVHVALFWLTAAGAVLLTVLFAPDRKLSLRERFVAAGAAGAGVLLGMYLLYPKFYLGVMVDADPFILATNFPGIGEMQPLFRIPFGLLIPELAAPVLAGFLLLLCLARGRKHLRSQPQKTRQLAILAALLAGTFVCSVVANRWAYYLQPVAIITIAALLPGVSNIVRGAVCERFFRGRRMFSRGALPFLWLGLAFAAMFSLVQLRPARMPDSLFCMAQVRYVLETQQLRPLLGNKNLVLVVHDSVAGDVLFFTPYRTVAANLHREGPELHDLHRIETAQTAAQEQALLRARQAGALLYCPARYRQDSWLRRIAEDDKYPKWLKPLSGLRFLDMPGPRPVLLQVKK